MRAAKETPEARDVRRAAAFERGWVHSLNGYDARAQQPVEDLYDYRRGWDECAIYRWADPANKGIAPDLNYRPVGEFQPSTNKEGSGG